MSHPKYVNKGNALGKFVEECGEAQKRNHRLELELLTSDEVES